MSSMPLAVESVLSILISKESLQVLQLRKDGHSYVVEASAETSLLLFGAHSDILSELYSIRERLQELFLDHSFNANHVIVAFDDIPFFKHCDNLHADEELVQRVNEQWSYQLHKPALAYDKVDPIDSELGVSETQPVFYMAIPEVYKEFALDLADSIGKSLLAVDMLPLSIVRAMWLGGEARGSFVSCYVHSNYVDFNVVVKGFIYASYTYQRPQSEMMTDALYIEALLQKLSVMLRLFKQRFPHLDMPEQLYYCSAFSDQSFIERLSDELSLTALEFSVQLSFPGVQVSSLAPFAVALKAFDASAPTLNFVPESERKDLILAQKQASVLKKALVLLASIVLIFLGLTWKRASINQQLLATQAKLRVLQSEKLLNKQHAMSRLQSYADIWEGPSKDASVTQLFYTLVKQMPDDISFDSVYLSDDGMLSVKGRSIFYESVYRFVNDLALYYPDVKLLKVKMDMEEALLHSSEFHVRFSWSRYDQDR